MSKCECCKEENSDLITYKGYKMCPDCYMGYVRKVKVCENNAKYETEIDQLKQQLAEKDKEIEDCKRNELYEENMKILAVKNQTQLAIQELEKVKEQLDKEIMIMSNFDDMKNQLKYLVEILVYIQQRIKELKGEKDVED